MKRDESIPPNAAAGLPGETVNILLVDDRPDKLLALETILSGLGQSLVTARSGAEALRQLLKNDFAVILLDVNMPGMDGFETAALIRKRQRSEMTPIIFVSAVNDTQTHVSRGYSLGAVDYILTPIVPEILRTKVAVFVDLFKKTRQIQRQAEQAAEMARAQAARAEAEAAQERLAFLAEAGSVLPGSLDTEAIFERAARLLVPQLGDYCVIAAPDEEGMWKTASAAHRDAGREAPLREALAREGAALPPAVRRVRETGCAESFFAQTEEALREFASGPEESEALKKLGSVRIILAPVLRRNRPVGVITLFAPTGGRAAPELSLIEAFAERVALALDNADLYRAAQKARLEAERASLAKDQFLAMLSHELRTPLTPVLAGTLTLLDGEAPPRMRETLEMIRRNIELEARLIDDLLDLTRIARGKLQLDCEPADAHRLLEHVLEICSRETAALKLEIALGAPDPHILADPARFQQIFWNLIKNAVKFTPPGGRLSIKSRNEEGRLLIEVADTGLGIEDDLLPKIFDAFEQGGVRGGGLGLGLAITRALVELHEGTIRAESGGTNRGTRFVLCFPLAGRAPQAAPATPASLAEVDRSACRILLVEDHEDTNRSLTLLLRKRGYQVSPAFNVRSALELAARERFDVLLSDMGLPDGSGLDVIRDGFDRGHAVLGIALSGFGMEADIRASREAGFRHHLVKPVDLKKLDELIQEGLAARLALALRR